MVHMHFYNSSLTLSSHCRHRNLTEKYYAKKAIRFITHNILKGEWTDYLALPEKDQRLEDGRYMHAVIILLHNQSWNYPDIFPEVQNCPSPLELRCNFQTFQDSTCSNLSWGTKTAVLLQLFKMNHRELLF